ncbi:MAG TPA: hypothetical protein VE155_13170 [Pseudonocardiaceae bacterium]|nr:hypothetical protein [Pseudonocardiaceae bacterium]
MALTVHTRRAEIVLRRRRARYRGRGGCWTTGVGIAVVENTRD